MEHFRAYLLSRQIIREKKLDYYLSRVAQFYDFCNKNPGDKISPEKIDNFLKHLMKTREDWQVDQANEAVRLYIYYSRRRYKEKADLDINSSAQWKAVAKDMIKMLRLKHRALSTEKSHISWVRSFYRFLNGRSP